MIAKEGSATKAMTKAELTGNLMEVVCERHNLKAAYRRVMKNKGSAGVDDMCILPDSFLVQFPIFLLNRI